jgi:NADH:ubiquinone oxidoreductase subunit K
MIPVALAWLGVLASVLLVVALPLQLAGLLRGPVTQLMWIPMAAFEIPLGLWLIVRGVRTPEHA